MSQQPQRMICCLLRGGRPFLLRTFLCRASCWARDELPANPAAVAKSRVHGCPVSPSASRHAVAFVGRSTPPFMSVRQARSSSRCRSGVPCGCEHHALQRVGVPGNFPPGESAVALVGGIDVLPDFARCLRDRPRIGDRPLSRALVVGIRPRENCSFRGAGCSCGCVPRSWASSCAPESCHRAGHGHRSLTQGGWHTKCPASRRWDPMSFSATASCGRSRRRPLKDRTHEQRPRFCP